MTETTAPEQLVASLTAALDEREATVSYAGPAYIAWLTYRRDDGRMAYTTVAARHHDEEPWCADGKDLPDPAITRTVYDPALERRQIAAHREIVDRYAETLRDYARTLERARGGPVANADLDDLEAELPVLRSVVEVIAGIYVTPDTAAQEAGMTETAEPEDEESMSISDYREPEDVLYVRPGMRGTAEPVIDGLTRKMAAAYRAAESNGVLWRGFHICRCGARSTNTDYTLPGGATTNSLCVHYLAFHRDEVPEAELAKVAALTSGEAEPNAEELAAPAPLRRPDSR